jgi:magnesium transporter
MLRYIRIDDGRLVDCDAQSGQILIYVTPDEAERRYLIDTLKLDEHTLNSSLDPDELARLEFEPEHAAMIFKRPKNYCVEDNFLFRVASTGLYLFKDRLIIVLSEDITLFEGKQFIRVSSLQDVILKLLYRVIFHFTEHLRTINMISGEIEQQINKSLENKSLINMFTLEKSLVYYLNAIQSNQALCEKLRNSAVRLGFTPENNEFLDDILIESNQCYRQAEIYSNILASLMDARASIVANNLNLLIKTLTIITIAIMLPTMVVSLFSMNVKMPFDNEHPLTFWFIFLTALASASAFWLYWRYKKW